MSIDDELKGGSGVSPGTDDVEKNSWLQSSGFVHGEDVDRKELYGSEVPLSMIDGDVLDDLSGEIGSTINLEDEAIDTFGDKDINVERNEPASNFVYEGEIVDRKKSYGPEVILPMVDRQIPADLYEGMDFTINLEVAANDGGNELVSNYVYEEGISRNKELDPVIPEVDLTGTSVAVPSEMNQGDIPEEDIEILDVEDSADYDFSPLKDDEITLPSDPYLHQGLGYGPAPTTQNPIGPIDESANFRDVIPESMSNNETTPLTVDSANYDSYDQYVTAQNAVFNPSATFVDTLTNKYNGGSGGGDPFDGSLAPSRSK